jgi:hypothetical protein
VVGSLWLQPLMGLGYALINLLIITPASAFIH